MKTLILIRHAKSSWDDPTLPDFDRPLNDRGKKDVPKMAKRLADKKVNIDAFISSPAKRAKKTTEIFIKEFDRDESDIILFPSLYHADVKDFYEAISVVDDKFKSIAVFSHNPGITSFANTLVEKAQIDNMPTCSVFAVNADIKNWSEFKDAKKEFLFFDFPKKDN
ncbi:MAG: histidine phosphatase family protein [Chitinophagaceae bacterium]|nr:histidine phosphatase family protein [Chitinophagaceae bacterium]